MDKKTLPLNAQRAAVRSLLDDEGKSMDWIKKKHPELAKGIKAVEAQMAKESEPKGSGSMHKVVHPTLKLPR